MDLAAARPRAPSSGGADRPTAQPTRSPRVASTCRAHDNGIPEREFVPWLVSALVCVRGLANVRHLNLASTITQAWAQPEAWTAGIADAYDIVVIDPLSAVGSALDLNFDQSNADFVKFYDRLVQPITTRGPTVVLLENVGHALEAKNRAKGASAKADRADLTFSCALVAGGLVITVHKVRTIRAAFQRGDEWIFHRESLTIERRITASTDAAPAFRPTTLMQRVSTLIAAQPGISKRAIRAGVQGRNPHIDAALAALLNEDHVERKQDGYHSLKPFDAEAENETPCPDRAPPTVPTVPTRAPSVPQGVPRAPGGTVPTVPIQGHGGTCTPNGHQPLPDDEVQRLQEIQERHDTEDPS